MCPVSRTLHVCRAVLDAQMKVTVKCDAQTCMQIRYVCTRVYRMAVALSLPLSRPPACACVVGWVGVMCVNESFQFIDANS